MKSDYKVRAEKFITRMAPVIKGCHSWRSVEARIDEYNKEHHTNIIVKHGAARCAIIYSDYVIKFDYGNNRAWAGGCEDEFQHWQKFKDSEYSYLFAEISKVLVGKKYFYIMPKVNNISTEKACYYMQHLSVAEYRFIMDNTADMHAGNYGCYKKKPLIIDYAMEP